MKKFDIIKQNDNSLWISITGYRILLLFIALLEKERTLDELVEILKNNKVTNKSVSKDTVRLTVKTLKMAGCKIDRPSKLNGFNYKLLSHPFSLNISNEDIQCLLVLRDRLSTELSADEIFFLNGIYKKIAALANKAELIKQIEDSAPLGEINQDIYNELKKPDLKGRKVSLGYKSPSSGEETIDIIPNNITFENGKLYLSGYIFKYEKFSQLDIGRITKINSVSLNKKIDYIESYEVEYKLEGNSMITFVENPNEKIIEKKENYIIVKANVTREFCFIQRLLLFGSDFKIISPDFFKQKIIDKIMQIKKWY